MEGPRRKTGRRIGDAKPFFKRQKELDRFASSFKVSAGPRKSAASFCDGRTPTRNRREHWRGKALYTRQKEPDRRASSFKMSADGTRFSFAPWWKTPKDPSMLSKYTSSLKLIGGYSEDEDKNFCNDKTSMNFMNMEYYPFNSSRELKVNLNLNLDAGENLEPYTGSTKQSLTNFLTWILSNEDVFAQHLSLDKESDRKGGKFVLMRNVLSEICITYLDRNEISFFATCFDGVVYIVQDKSLKKMKTQYISDWGRIFEHQITQNQRTDEKIIFNADYRIVTSTCLGEHRIILSSATDCFHPDKYKESIQDTYPLIALKCCYDNPTNDRTKRIERYNMFRWCLGLCLSGIPKLLVGYRNRHGIVELLKLYNRRDLMKNGQGYWDIETTFVFLQHLLSFVKVHTTSKPGQIFKFSKKDQCHFYTCSEEVKEMIPEWFRKEYKKLKRSSKKYFYK